MSETPATAADDTPDSNATSPWRWAKWAVIGVLAVVAVAGGLIAWRVITTDSPDKLDATDLSERVAGTTTDDGGADATAADGNGEVAGTMPAATDPVPATDTSPVDASAGFDGDWVPTTASEFGYRIDEVLAGVNVTAVGRGNDITGVLTIDGTTATAIDVEIQVATIESDDGRRDGQFRGRIMETDQFPTATFSLTSPIDFGEIPDEGEQITVAATGDLTLHGVTREVTFELTAEATAGRIGVLGSIPVLFSDYDIANPSFGAVTTEDNGLLEFVLVFERP